MDSQALSTWTASISAPFLATFKHMAGRHNQKRHGWRYGRNMGTSGLSESDLARGRAISTRSGRMTAEGKRIVAAQVSMRRTPEQGEREEYRRRSDLPRPIPYHTRPGASASDRSSARIIESVFGSERLPVRGGVPTPRAVVPTPTPAPRPPTPPRPPKPAVPKPPKPAAPAAPSTRIATPRAANASADNFNDYWSRQLPNSPGRTTSANILAAAKEAGIKDPTNWIKNTFTYKDDESGLYSEIRELESRSPHQIRASGVIRNKAGARMGMFTRTLDTTHMDVHHDYFTLDASEQGSGFGSRFYQHLERNYIKAKVKTISIFANLSVGGYAWARMGFDFSSNASLGRFVTRLKETWLSAYRKPYSGPALKHAWDIAAVKGPDGRKIGKDIMLGESWDGIKNLTKGSISRHVGESYYAAKAKKGKEPK